MPLMLVLHYSLFFVCKRNEIESEVLSLRAKQNEKQNKNDDVNEPTESEVSKIITKSLSRLFCVPCLFFHGICFNEKKLHTSMFVYLFTNTSFKDALALCLPNVYTPLANACMCAGVLSASKKKNNGLEIVIYFKAINELKQAALTLKSMTNGTWEFLKIALVLLGARFFFSHPGSR